MKVTKRQIRRIINEAFTVSDRRRGFLGMGFGGVSNNYDPYAKHRLYEEEFPVPVEDAWAGGDNLVDPVDNLKVDTGLENVKEPESLDISLTEHRLRLIIRKALLRVGK